MLSWLLFYTKKILVAASRVRLDGFLDSRTLHRNIVPAATPPFRELAGFCCCLSSQIKAVLGIRNGEMISPEAMQRKKRREAEGWGYP